MIDLIFSSTFRLSLFMTDHDCYDHHSNSTEICSLMIALVHITACLHSE